MAEVSIQTFHILHNHLLRELSVEVMGIFVVFIAISTWFASTSQAATVSESRRRLKDDNLDIDEWCKTDYPGQFGCHISVQDTTSDGEMLHGAVYQISSSCVFSQTDSDSISCQIADNRLSYKTKCSISKLSAGSQTACVCEEATATNVDESCMSYFGCYLQEEGAESDECRWCKSSQATCGCTFGGTDDGVIDYNGIPFKEMILNRILSSPSDHVDLEWDWTQPSIQKRDIGWNMDLKCEEDVDTSDHTASLSDFEAVSSAQAANAGDEFDNRRDAIIVAVVGILVAIGGGCLLYPVCYRLFICCENRKLQCKIMKTEDEEDTFSEVEAGSGPEEEKEKRQLMRLDVLKHAASCEKCSAPKCNKMKEYFEHIKLCDLDEGSCVKCTHMWDLLRVHAQQCDEPECPVPHCSTIRIERARLYGSYASDMDTSKSNDLQANEVTAIRERLEAVLTRKGKGGQKSLQGDSSQQDSKVVNDRLCGCSMDC